MLFQTDRNKFTAHFFRYFGVAGSACCAAYNESKGRVEEDTMKHQSSIVDDLCRSTDQFKTFDFEVRKIHVFKLTAISSVLPLFSI